MVSTEDQLKSLGGQLAALQDEALDRGSITAEVRDELLARVPLHRAAARRSRRARFAAAGTALAAAAAVALVLVLGDGQPAATVGNDGDPLVVGASIEAPGTEPVPIRFSDGSSVVLEAGATARVVSTRRNGARVRLERGQARVRITHLPDTDWRFDVGPYGIAVVGTAFTTSWGEDGAAFTLSLEEGSVRVSGPLMAEGRLVAAGEEVRAWVDEGRLELLAPGGERGRAPEQLAAASETGTPDEVNGEVEAAPEPEPRARKARPDAGPGERDRQKAEARGSEPTEDVNVPEASWQELARQGRYREAMAVVDSRGFDSVVRDASPADLLVLGDAARLIRNWERADHCYRQVRERYPGSERATTAAFSLGRMAFDQQHLYRKAARWLEVYLAESGSGSLAREASGRLFEAWHRAGNPEAAARTARQYLEQFPGGPHAHLATQVLEEREDPERVP